jgi:hypothetical protein
MDCNTSPPYSIIIVYQQWQSTFLNLYFFQEELRINRRLIYTNRLFFRACFIDYCKGSGAKEQEMNSNYNKKGFVRAYEPPDPGHSYHSKVAEGLLKGGNENTKPGRI